MMKKLLFLGLVAAAVLTGCSSEEPVVNEPSKVFPGNEAYISVRLADAGALSRATTEDPGYEYGTDKEHTVSNAYFYFYDEDGLFVAEGSAWNGGTASEKDPENPDGNIEFKSNTIVVLKGLKNANYPKYMVTVLNREDKTVFEPAKKLADMLTTFSNKNAEGIENDGGFVMSTTSYVGGGADGYYFVNELAENNFELEPITEPKNPVTVYVERLAAKVTLGTSLTSVTIDGKDVYKINATVAGEGNDEDRDANAKKENQTATEELYVEFLGWRLNATAKYSNIVKKIDEKWTADDLGFTWSNANENHDYRSFWGMSFNYGDTKYSYPGTVNPDKDNSLAKVNCPLNYYTLDESDKDFKKVGQDAYCPENTNTSDILSKNGNYPNAVTHVLLKAKVWTKSVKDGKTVLTAPDLVRFNGVLFSEERFANYVISILDTNKQWNIWREATDADNTDEDYVQLDAKALTLDNDYDGKVILKLNVTADGLYTQGADGKFTAMEANANLISYNDNLADKCRQGDANGFKGGEMYYVIPIEHLNDTKVDGEIHEANYGVVRNHHYVITVNKLESLGKGIFNPDEVIVPGDDFNKKTYYVGATINILSWKIVKQNVNL